MDTLEKQVRSFIEENFLFGQDSELTNNDSFLTAGILDSTGVLQLIGYIQDEYGITVEDEEVVPDNLDSVNLVAAYLRRKLEAARPRESTAVHQEITGGAR